MLEPETLSPRPTLVNASLIARTLDGLRPKDGSRDGSTADLWRLLTDRYVVDLDAVAALLPNEEPDTIWLAARG